MGFGPLTMREWCALVRLVTASGGPTERHALARLVAHHDVGDAVGWPRTVSDHDPAPRTGEGAIADPTDDGLDDEALEAVETGDGAENAAATAIDVEQEPVVRDADWWEAEPQDLGLDQGAETGIGPEVVIDQDEGTPPPFALFGSDGQEVRWDLVGPEGALLGAVEAVGLDRNAVQSSVCDHDEPEGVISHPSAFCPDPVRFLAALALTTKSTPHARLFRVRADSEGKATAVVRVFPDPDDDVIAELDRFLPDAVDQMHDLSEAVSDSLEALNRAMDEAALDIEIPDAEAAPGSG